MNTKKHEFTLTGIVVSNAMDKTLVVKVDNVMKHPKYHKKVVWSKKYKVHVPNSKDFAIGQKVSFRYCRPISKSKTWVIVPSV